MINKLKDNKGFWIKLPKGALGIYKFKRKMSKRKYIVDFEENSIQMVTYCFGKFGVAFVKERG